MSQKFLLNFLARLVNIGSSILFCNLTIYYYIIGHSFKCSTQPINIMILGAQSFDVEHEKEAKKVAILDRIYGVEERRAKFPHLNSYSVTGHVYSGRGQLM